MTSCQLQAIGIYYFTLHHQGRLLAGVMASDKTIVGRYINNKNEYG